MKAQRGAGFDDGLTLGKWQTSGQARLYMDERIEMKEKKKKTT